MNIRAQIAQLEARYGTDQQKPIVLFDDTDPQTIEAAKHSGRVLILLSESHGYEVWADGSKKFGQIQGAGDG